MICRRIIFLQLKINTITSRLLSCVLNHFCGVSRHVPLSRLGYTRIRKNRVARAVDVRPLCTSVRDSAQWRSAVAGTWQDCGEFHAAYTACWACRMSCCGNADCRGQCPERRSGGGLQGDCHQRWRVCCDYRNATGVKCALPGPSSRGREKFFAIDLARTAAALFRPRRSDAAHLVYMRGEHGINAA